MRYVTVPVSVSAVVGLLVAGVAWAIGVTLRQSAVLAVCVVAAGAARGIIAIQQRASAGDQWRGRWTTTRGGGRREVQQLAWGLGADRGRIHGGALRRLRSLAERRLHAHGIDLADPDHARAAEALLGTTAHRVVTAEPGQNVRYAAFAQAVDAIERLRPPVSAPAPASPRPEPR